MKGIPQFIKPSNRICLNSNASLNPRCGSRWNSLIHCRHTVPNNTVPKATVRLKNQHMFVTTTVDDGRKALSGEGKGGMAVVMLFAPERNSSWTEIRSRRAFWVWLGSALSIGQDIVKKATNAAEKSPAFYFRWLDIHTGNWIIYSRKLEVYQLLLSMPHTFLYHVHELLCTLPPKGLPWVWGFRIERVDHTSILRSLPSRRNAEVINKIYEKIFNITHSRFTHERTAPSWTGKMPRSFIGPSTKFWRQMVCARLWTLDNKCRYSTGTGLWAQRFRWLSFRLWCIFWRRRRT